MPTATLLLAGIVSILTGVVFASVALAIGRRPTPREMRRANLTFGLWWGLLGAYLVVQGAVTVVAAYDALTLDAYLATRLLIIPLLAGAVGCLMHHLVYLYTGSERWSAAAGLAYAPIGGLLAYATFGTAQELRVSEWLVTLDDSGAPYRLAYVLVGIPPILGSLAYLALLRRVQDPLQRMRVWLVSLSIIAYVGSGLAARLAATDAVKVVTLVGLGIAAASLVLVAYHPPRALVAWVAGRREA